jgi:7,8-dihydropterin-6-yl-methyl-4-(beta-D-ribofuranosyl)aminobenzene 5'-phosphate synthase
LVIIDNDELVIISGCAHSGICNIIDYGISITGITKVKGVIGGFHLKHNNKQTQKTINYFKEQNIKYIYPSHCTELAALSAFNLSFPLKQVKTGMVFEFN